MRNGVAIRTKIAGKMKNIINKCPPVIAFVCALLLVSCKQVEDRLFVVERNERYGYIDIKGDTVINCIYPLAYTDTIYKIGFVADYSGRIRCFSNKGEFLFFVYKYDNGPDYPSEGLFRIVDEKGLVGFADTSGKIIVPPQFRYAFPSVNGEAKVTKSGFLKIDSLSADIHEYWESEDWYYIKTKN